MNAFNPTLYACTPTVTVMDNRGLLVRDIVYHRTTAGEQADTRITRHQYSPHNFLIESIDPRLFDLQSQSTIKPNFTYWPALKGDVLRTESVDAGQTIILNDTEGRPLLNISAMGVVKHWQYEESALPGRLLAVSERKSEASTPQIIERFIWAGNSSSEKDHNLAGKYLRHYDTAGLNQLNAVSLTGVDLSQSRQLLQDNVTADWSGSDESQWKTRLSNDIFTTEITADVVGNLLIQNDAKSNQQRLAYDVAGLLQASWLTIKGQNEQVIVKSLTYSAAGQKLREEQGNGVITEYRYEAQTRRLTGITTYRQSDKKRLQDLVYNYDPVGNLLNIRNNAEATRFWRNQVVEPENHYAYDSLYQLISASGREIASIGQQGSRLPVPIIPLPANDDVYTRYTRTYHYDRGGNLSQIRHSAPATDNKYTTKITVSNRSNRAVWDTLTTDPAKVDTLFDHGGHQLQLQSGQTLCWNHRGELQQITKIPRDEKPADKERYRYGVGAARVVKISTQQAGGSSHVQRVVYLPGLELCTTQHDATLIEDLQVIIMGEAGRAQVRVLHWEIPPPDNLNNDSLRYSYDSLMGSSQLELDGAGQIITREEYYPYGGTALWAARNQTEANYKTIRYSGKERDATGLYYYGHRYYQPWLGRWLSADPAGTVDGLNLYRMVRNNPITYTDVGGLAPIGREVSEGIYEPRLRTKAELDGPDATLYFSRQKELKTTFSSIHPEEMLFGESFETQAISTEPINISSRGASPEVQKVLKTGGELVFTGIRIGTGAEIFNALKFVDSYKQEIPEQGKFVVAYWAPQGGHVDIPMHPNPSRNPTCLFTPGFSGCTLAVDKIDDQTLRVFHVSGGHEREEYHELDAAEHGEGLAMAMDYLDYGFYQENGQTMNNITAFAFMHYNQEERKWGIHYQRQAGAPNIREFSPPSRSNKNNIEVRVSESSYIKGTGTMRTHFPHHQPQ
ncbi:RHS repeat protein [Xenorhabdus bovienii]|uniref:RHS repeat domain-containing protein n=1 Tax=Xenorhabdus bovienii TaxID=40576 RepID=UPI0023B31FBE|nr:RHS repeat domain-containing protein [Xenorhabdus bovienii]MDE9434428.1 RHS repeat protein [Xenorhabdus bovienii]MDE9496652.1 RHS repeat protein [Xenorhabdus bovienii]